MLRQLVPRDIEKMWHATARAVNTVNSCNGSTQRRRQAKAMNGSTAMAHELQRARAEILRTTGRRRTQNPAEKARKNEYKQIAEGTDYQKGTLTNQAATRCKVHRRKKWKPKSLRPVRSCEQQKQLGVTILQRRQ